MTKAYNDIEAVTTLLEEKERDLELAARIGQSLLQKNKDLERRNSDQEEQLVECNDKIKQLRHDLAQKEALLQVYLEEESSPETPESERLQLSMGMVNMGGLQKKVKSLEEENLSLRSQSASLKTETVLAEEKEQQLFTDCVRQLEDYKTQVLFIQDDIIAKSDVNLRQQEEITALTAKTIAQDGQIKKLTDDGAEMTRRLQAAQEAQKDLAAEIAELEAKNEELELLIREAQEEMKILKKKQKPGFIRHHASYNSPFLPEGSLALELEDSMRKEVPCPPGYTPKERRQHSKRVMQTAKVVQRAQLTAGKHSPGGSVSNENESCESIVGSSVRSSLYLSEGELSETGYGADVDSVYGSTSALGRPGLPGSNDLETALRRLTLQRTHESHDRERRRRRVSRSDGLDTPTSCHTPDSTMSNGSFSNLSDFSRMSSISSSFRIPGKLQIVKPLEGSYTLHQWKRLATPHLAGVLEHRPGVQHKGELSSGDLEEEEIYSLSDYEEDDDFSLHLGKCMEQTSSIYTFTTAKILHPSDEYGTSTPTPRASHFAEMRTPPSVLSTSCTSTPIMTSGVSYMKLSDGGTSTFSMSAGLAWGLNERGIQDGRSPIMSTRYGNIVTETVSSATQSKTSVFYSTPSCTGDISVRNSTSVTVNQSENAYLQLADKVKDIGLNSILNIANRSGITPVTLDPVDSGLNVIMSIKRNKGAVNRCVAEKASQTIQYTRYTKPRASKGFREGTTSIVNSTRVAMSAPLPITMEKVDDDEDEVLKTLLPSILVAPKRPNSLNLSSTEPLKHEHDEPAVPSNDPIMPALCSGVTVSGNTLSSGLLNHLSGIYTRTRDLLGGPGIAPEAALLPSNKGS